MTIHGVWFRKDLRLTDHTALLAALSEKKQETDSFMGIFHLNPEQFKENSMNHAYFFSALVHFSQVAEEAGFPIHFLYGTIETAFTSLKEKVPELTDIYYNEDQRGFGKKRDEEAEKIFKKLDLTTHSFQDSHLHGGTEIRKPDGTAFKVFTPYYHRWREGIKPKFQRINQEYLAGKAVDKREDFKEGEDHLERLMKPIDPIWLKRTGAKLARKHLTEFLHSGIDHYQDHRDFPSEKGTSQLSRFLRTGEISIREVYQRVVEEAPDTEGKATFIKELCWRDFYHMIYVENPKQKELEIQEKYRHLSWNQNKHFLEAWKKGETGFPLVDAAMKQLNETGWMHNRLRMVVASFLVKDLLVDWREGEAYFAQQLIDYDPASNIGGWQWAASTGTDAVPYFRIFNPTTQSQRFDKEGAFIREHLPILAKVPVKYIHEPGKLPLEMQKELNVRIGKDYPAPIVDHKKMRQEAIALFKGE